MMGDDPVSECMVRQWKFGEELKEATASKMAELKRLWANWDETDLARHVGDKGDSKEEQ